LLTPTKWCEEDIKELASFILNSTTSDLNKRKFQVAKESVCRNISSSCSHTKFTRREQIFSREFAFTCQHSTRISIRI
jgi:hypothetical protein